MLHSTGQLYSHKRKHERRDFEHAYRRFKDDQKNKTPPTNTPPNQNVNPAAAIAKNVAQQVISGAVSGLKGAPLNLTSDAPKQEPPEYIDMEELQKINQSAEEVEDEPMELKHNSNPVPSLAQNSVKSEPSTPEDVKAEFPESNDKNKPLPSTLAKLASKLSGAALDGSLNLPIPDYEQEEEEQTEVPASMKDELACVGNHGGIQTNVPGFIPKTSPPINEKREKDESWKKYLTRYSISFISIIIVDLMY